MLNVKLYIIQRISALIMVPLIVGHIAVMIYAVHDGLSTAEILERTQGSYFWLGFYGLFVLAVSIHAAIGLSVIINEWLKIKGALLNIIAWGSGAGLMFMGGRAVLAVTLL